MGSRHKGTDVLLILIMLLTVWYWGTSENTTENSALSTGFQKDTIYFWYTDEALTDYINSAAVSFYDDYDVRVVPVLHTGLEYVEEINRVSVDGNELPDLYLIGSESLEKVIMTGLASGVEDTDNILTSSHFPQTALNAVTYHDTYFAYPFYYETAFLLYNETHLRAIADAALRMELQPDMGEDEDYSEVEEYDPLAEYSDEQWNEMVRQKMNELIPSSIEDILAIADSYDAPEQVENIFRWDVSDILYNYFFAGAYMDVGGSCGDDSSIIEIYNEDSVACLHVYQDLQPFFSIESKESSYEAVMEEFLSGKSVFVIATSDALRSLETARAEGEFPYAYGVAPLPGIDGDHEARGLSVTSVIVINGYSMQKEMANLFAEYLVYRDADTLYDRTHKMQASYPIEDFIYDNRDRIMDIYKNSTSLPKILEASNFWVQLELAYIRIWDGENVDEVLWELSEQMKTQITGGNTEELFPDTESVPVADNNADSDDVCRIGKLMPAG